MKYVTFLLGHTKIKDTKCIPDLLRKQLISKSSKWISELSVDCLKWDIKGIFRNKFKDWLAQNTEGSEHWTRAYYYYYFANQEQ